MIAINMNATAIVTLTQRGAEIYNAFQYAMPSWSARMDLEEGAVLRLQLWELFEIFGSRMCHGMPQVPFENNEIKLEPLP